MTKRSDDEVIEIRQLRALGAPGRILAHMYNVSVRSIYGVCSSQTRKRLPTVQQLKEATSE